jgi:predicted O-linked N-acetylglucosamine transferase (SPINDLY family)
MFDWFKRNRIAESKPRDLSADIAEADALRERGEIDRALAAYQAVHHADPSRVYPIYWLATLHQETGSLHQAADYAERGLALDPSQVGLLLRAGDIAKARQDFVTALRHYESARAIDPTIPMINALIADQLCHGACVDEGIQAFRRALAETPDDVALQQNLLFVMNFSDFIAPAALADAHRAWGELHESKRVGASQRRRQPMRMRPRIGYVSPDLRNHAVSYFVDSLFTQHRAAGTEFVVFDLAPGTADDIASGLRQVAPRWISLGGQSADDVAEAIRRDDIDILVDLAGHTNHNRLLAFAQRPAPIQVSWLGYLQTTGLSAMDYRLTDRFMDPEGLTEALYTEELVRLPVQACFTPRPHTPEVAPIRTSGPALRFGSLNNWSKTSPSARAAWGSILRACPDAELAVIARGGQHATVRQWIVDQLVAEGASPTQIVIEPVTNTRDFLQWLGSVDVVLDPFPYGGGTTTMHCLYMGVPVVTLAGDRAMARNSVGPLHSVGLSDLVAESRESYRAIAIALARDRARLAVLRATLRPLMKASPIMDAVAFARSLDDAFAAMYQRLQ